MNPDLERPSPPDRKRLRWLLAVIISALATLYTLAVVFSGLPPERRLDGTNLMILGLAALIVILLVKPDIIEHVKRFKLSGFELELAKIKNKQDAQQGQLEAIKLLLPLLLREAETKHLRFLGEAVTTQYEGSHPLRTELRRLRTLGLVELLEGRRIRDLGDGMIFDLSDHVRLTSLGWSMFRQLEAIDKAEADKAA